MSTEDDNKLARVDQQQTAVGLDLNLLVTTFAEAWQRSLEVQEKQIAVQQQNIQLGHVQATNTHTERMKSIEAGLQTHEQTVELERYRISQEVSLQRLQLLVKAAMATGLAITGIAFLFVGREGSGMGLILGAVGILTGFSNVLTAARALFRPPREGGGK